MRAHLRNPGDSLPSHNRGLTEWVELEGTLQTMSSNPLLITLETPVEFLQKLQLCL